MSDKADRTQKATARKRRKAREKGQVARSRDLPFAVGFAFLVLLLGFRSDYFIGALKEPFRFFWSHGFGVVVSSNNLQMLFLDTGRLVLLATWPVLAMIFLVSVGSLFAQGGFVLTGEPLKPSPARLNPAKNVQKVFSKNGIMQLAKSLAMVAIIVYLAYTAIRDNFDQISLLPMMDLRSILATWGSILYSVGLRVSVFLVILAVGDLVFQRYQHEENLKMTKQEVKDEFKDTEGNPTVKGRIRRLQLEMARRRMMAAVQDADVVIANPTHFAVALKFDMATMSAPEVVAKGADYLALRIRRVAEEHKVPVIEEPELARTLYGTVELGDEIPMQLYRAVAQILAYVFKLRRTRYH